MMFGFAVILGVFAIGAASTVDEVVASTDKVIVALKDLGSIAQSQLANVSTFDLGLNKIGRAQKEKFDMKAYSEKQRAYSKLAQLTLRNAKLARDAENASDAEEALVNAQIAFKNMTRVGDKLGSEENAFREQLKGALDAKLNPQVSIVDEISKNASRLQHASHSIMDPLYGMGDAAEDKADALNDQTNDALSAIESPVRMYRRHIINHASDVQSSVERKLFGHNSDHRVSTYRKVHDSMLNATLHVNALKSVNLSALGNPTLLIATLVAIAAVAAALSASLVLKSRSIHGVEHPLLSEA
jgi:hypothetical protein